MKAATLTLMHFIYLGVGGIRKSTAMKQFSRNWTDGHEALKKFNFVFHIALKSVRGQKTIESIIVAQHTGLCSNNVQDALVKLGKFILEKVLEEDKSQIFQKVNQKLTPGYTIFMNKTTICEILLPN